MKPPDDILAAIVEVSPKIEVDEHGGASHAYYSFDLLPLTNAFLGQWE